MATVSELIDLKIDQANAFVSLAAEAIAEITSRRGVTGYTQLGIDPADFRAKYVKPAADTTPFPVYHEPTAVEPNAPTLVDLSAISQPAIPAAPAVNTQGLFNHQMPSNNIPDFTADDPQLHANEIYNAIAAVMQPVLEEVVLPDIAPLVIRAVPQVILPGYTSMPLPAELNDAPDYATYFRQQYEQRLPGIRGLVDDMMDTWIQKYAPEYVNVRSQLSLAIERGLAGEALPMQHEAALYSRHQARIQREMNRAEQGITNNPAARGWVVPPGSVRSAVDQLEIERARTLAGESTNVYIEIRRAAIQAYQFILSMADGQLNSIRGFAMQFADKALQIMREAANQAKTLADLLALEFEHEKSRAEFSLALMKAAYDKFEAELKIAMADLEIFKVELSALEAQKNVELKLLDAAKIKLDVQRLKVDNYSAIIDAIAKRAVADELLIKEFEVKAKVFDIQIKAVLAAFDAYEAAMNGDKAKLEGELAKVDVYKSQLQGINLKLDAEKSVLDGQVETNKAKLGQFTAQLGAYETSARIALQRFSSEAEIKKLGMSVYNTNVQANVDVFRAELQKDISLQGAITDAFRGNVASLSNFYQLEAEYAKLNQVGSIAIAEGYSNMASAANSSVNGVLSFASAA